MNLLAAAGSRLAEVRINRLAEGVFYAVAVVETPRGSVEVDASLSDAVNLAVLAGVQIRVDAAILDDRWWTAILSGSSTRRGWLTRPSRSARAGPISSLGFPRTTKAGTLTALLKRSASTVFRIENGRNRPQPGDVSHVTEAALKLHRCRTGWAHPVDTGGTPARPGR